MVDRERIHQTSTDGLTTESHKRPNPRNKNRDLDAHQSYDVREERDFQQENETEQTHEWSQESYDKGYERDLSAHNVTEPTLLSHEKQKSVFPRDKTEDDW